MQYQSMNRLDLYMQSDLPRHWQLLSFYYSMAERDKDKKEDKGK